MIKSKLYTTYMKQHDCHVFVAGGWLTNSIDAGDVFLESAISVGHWVYVAGLPGPSPGACRARTMHGKPCIILYHVVLGPSEDRHSLIATKLQVGLRPRGAG